MKKVILLLTIIIAVLFPIYGFGKFNDKKTLKTVESDHCSIVYSIVQDKDGQINVILEDKKQEDYIVAIVENVDDGFTFIYIIEDYFKEMFFNHFMRSLEMKRNPVKAVINLIVHTDGTKDLTTWKQFPQSGDYYLEYDLR